jgi:hypothetical protein
MIHLLQLVKKSQNGTLIDLSLGKSRKPATLHPIASNWWRETTLALGILSSNSSICGLDPQQPLLLEKSMG